MWTGSSPGGPPVPDSRLSSADRMVISAAFRRSSCSAWPILPTWAWDRRTVGRARKEVKLLCVDFWDLSGFYWAGLVRRRRRDRLGPLALEHLGQQAGQSRVLQREPAADPDGHGLGVQAEHDGGAVHHAEPGSDPVDEADALPVGLPLPQPSAEFRIAQGLALEDRPVADPRPQGQVIGAQQAARPAPAGAHDLVARAGDHRLLPGPGRLAVPQELDEVEGVLGGTGGVVAVEQVGDQPAGVLDQVGLLGEGLLAQELRDGPGVGRSEARDLARLLGEQALLDQQPERVVGLGPADAGELGELGGAHAGAADGGEVQPGLVAPQPELGETGDELVLVAPSRLTTDHAGERKG